MSMNLCFYTKTGKEHVEFPYQTSTKLTRKVLAEKSIEKKLDLIKEDLIDKYDMEDRIEKDLFNERISEIEDLLRDDNLELTMI